MDGERSRIVSIDWLAARLGHASRPRVVDARTLDAYHTGHIPGAVHSDQNLLRLPDSRPATIVHFHRIVQAEIRRLGIQPGDRVVFYEDFSGPSAARGVWLLDYAGIGGGAILDGGLNAWVESGGALTREVPLVTPSETTVSPVEDVLATAGELQSAIGAADPTVRVIDTRNALEFQSGTIPNSTHIDWVRHLDADGRLRPLSQLAELYETAGLTGDTSQGVVTFCGSGYRAAHSYIVLKALGFPRVKNYAPSWGEWGRRADLPVERPMKRD